MAHLAISRRRHFVIELFVCSCVRQCAIMYSEFVNTMFHKRHAEISPNLWIAVNSSGQDGSVYLYWMI